jgi:phage terminase large subunit-like protein
MTQSRSSLASSLRALSPEERTKILEQLRPEAVVALRHAWRFWARPEQLAPGTPGAAIDRTDWTFWLLLAGRGFGKTRAGAEFSIEKARTLPGSHGALVAATADDARKTMLSAGLAGSDGASGVLAVSPPDFAPIFEPSKRTITWPNGSAATLYSAEEPDRLRGPSHHWGWADETAAWQGQAEAWDQFLFGLRLGTHPQACITTTPRPIRIVRELLADPRCVVTRGTTFDNADNLAPSFLSKIASKYDGTRVGRQELYAEMLDDVPGALWTRAILDKSRVQQAPELRRIVVAVDPSAGHKEDNDEQGIVVAGLGVDAHGYTLADRTCRMSPDGWGRRVVQAYLDFQADVIVFEANFGGEMCEHVILTAAQAMGVRVNVKMVRASRGKAVRAEPIAALFEQARAHHVGAFDQLEDEQCSFTPLGYDRSPNRVDAEVWAYTELMLDEQSAEFGDGEESHRRI